jgi:hypothetical protein
VRTSKFKKSLAKKTILALIEGQSNTKYLTQLQIPFVINATAWPLQATPSLTQYAASLFG